MKKSRYTAEQVAFAMRQAELGTPVPEWWQRSEGEPNQQANGSVSNRCVQ
jgi:hypothetical protein